MEDNEDVRSALEHLLGRKGHTVETAGDGWMAIEKAAEFLPDVALIDIGLPGMNGYEVAEHVRAGTTTQPYLIAVTGYGQPSDRSRAIASGFDLHLTKPIDFAHLEDALRKVRIPAEAVVA